MPHSNGNEPGGRFFRATALGGDLHFIDVNDWDQWEPSRIRYLDEAEVQWLVRAGAGDRRIIRAAAELESAILDSAPSQSVYLYLDETLSQDALGRWEEMRRNRDRGRALLRRSRARRDQASAHLVTPPVTGNALPSNDP